MYTLFSLESEDSELLIDKVIRKADQDKDGLRVTADLIKQRQKLKVEIDKELSTPLENKEDGGDGEDADDSSVEQETTDAKEEDADEPEQDNSDKAESPAESKTADKDTEDPVEASQSEEDLEAMMGSGGKESQAKDEGKAPESKEKVAKEAFSGVSVILPALFTGIREKHQHHTWALEQYNLAPKSTDPKVQPVAYVKEEVLGSLNKMVKLATTYLAKNTTVAENTHKALLSLNESLTVYGECHTAEKLHLTLKVVSEEGKLKSLCTPDESDLKETAGALLKYLGNTASLSAMVLENDLTSLPASLQSLGYQEQEGAYTYQKVLPGFNQMNVACSTYQDYLTTQYQDYQAYRTQVYKVQELYDLSGVTLPDDKTLVSVLERLNAVLTQLALMTDNLKDLSVKYAALIEQVKATAHDVEHDKVKQLAQLGLDDRLKDFIRFKVVSELYTTSIEVGCAYVVGVLAAFSDLIELND